MCGIAGILSQPEITSIYHAFKQIIHNSILQNEANITDLVLELCKNLKQNAAQSARAESAHKGVN